MTVRRPCDAGSSQGLVLYRHNGLDYATGNEEKHATLKGVVKAGKKASVATPFFPAGDHSPIGSRSRRTGFSRSFLEDDRPAPRGDQQAMHHKSTIDTSENSMYHASAAKGTPVGEQSSPVVTRPIDGFDGSFFQPSNGKPTDGSRVLTDLTDLTVNQKGGYVAPTRAPAPTRSRPRRCHIPTPLSRTVKSVKRVKSQDGKGWFSPPCRQTGCQIDGNPTGEVAK